MIMTCRICLEENADNDIYTLPMAIDTEKSSEDIILFCLGIELSGQSKKATKLCSTCHENVVKYYKFKLLAQESNTYLNSLNLNKVEWNDKYSLDFYNDESNIILNEQVKDEPDYDNYESLEPEWLDDNLFEEDTSELKTIKEEQYEPTNPIPVPPRKEYPKKKIKKKVNASRNKVFVKPSFICVPCGKEFSSKYSMQVHRGKFHSNATNFHCDHCPLSYFRKFDLQRHIDKLHMEWKCHICKLLLKNRLSYLNHCKSHREGNILVQTEMKPKLKVCPVCGKLIVNLSKHLDKHKVNPKLYHCKVCEKKYRSPHGRERHYKSRHQGVMYHCDICDKDVKNLQSHRYDNHRSDDLKHSCSVCGYLAVSAARLAIHVSTHLEPHLPCPKCPKLFKSEERLKMHSRQVHEGEIRHRCSECLKGFFYKSDLTIHLASHTSKRPYQCDTCYEPFKLRRNLIKHFKTNHKKIF